MTFSFDIVVHATAAPAPASSTRRAAPIETPVFMPVGTLATVKALDPDDLRAMHAQIILANAYHLHLRPGDELVRRMGGLHRFMAWDGPILTDSGGFQVFSLASLNSVSEDGVEFKSHVDGSPRAFTPESVMRIETNLGADVDHAVRSRDPGPERSRRREGRERAQPALARALPRGIRPAARDGRRAARRRSSRSCRAASTPTCAARPRCTSRRTGPWDGIAIGGLSVGEEKPAMYEMLDVCDDAIPRDRPRYLMGVGFPEDLVEGVARGVDLFDCVAPTRMGRNAAAFTPRRDGSTSGTPRTARTRARSTRAAAAPPAAASRGPTSGTSSRARRFSPCAFSPCTMYISSSP